MRTEGRSQRVLEHRGDVHQPIRSFRPRMPCGRTITAMMRTASATAMRYFVEIQYVDTCDVTPMMIAPTIGPYAVPRPPSTTAANISNKRLKPRSEVTVSLMPNSTPPSAASAPHPIHV